MSRACLSGIPFIWHAYPQSDEYQLVKVKALLERMRPHFDEEDFDIVSKAWLEINGETWIATPSARNDARFFSSLPRLVPCFKSFAQSLRKNGDLCTNLMTFINKIDIIDR
jgi:hypothetical protein